MIESEFRLFIEKTLAEPYAEEFLSWFDSRPEPIKKLCLEFPPGSTIDYQGQIHYICGYSQEPEDCIIFCSEIDSKTRKPLGELTKVPTKALKQITRH